MFALNHRYLWAVCFDGVEVVKTTKAKAKRIQKRHGRSVIVRIDRLRDERTVLG